MGTLLLSNGKIVDGSGQDSFRGHVLIEGERIREICSQKVGIPAADEVIDVAGAAITPGFIDMHSHADWHLPDPDHPTLMKCLVEQGITTIIAGNCGISPAPYNAETFQYVETLASILMDKPIDYQWQTMSEFLTCLEQFKPLVNIAELVGHAAVRIAYAGTRRGKMKAAELSHCLAKTHEALDQGACGISFGLGYDPGMYSPLEELKAFCLVAQEAGKPVAVHLKAYSWLSPCYHSTTPQAHNVKALQEMLNIVRQTGVKLQMSHFLFVGRKSWKYAARTLQIIDRAVRDGLDVMIDAFPYTCGNTTILATLPFWFLAGLPAAFKNRKALLRLRVELELGFRLVGFRYHDFQVMATAVPGWEHLYGLTIPEIAQKWNTSSFQTLLKLSETSQGGALILFHTYSGDAENQKPLEAVLKHEQCLFETDVALKSKAYPNPAGLGTYPKILGTYVRDQKLFTIESAIKRMTSASAERFGLTDRGLLAPGKFADVVVFDPDTIAETPPVGPKPASKPVGIKYVFINGNRVVENGDYNVGERSGRVLRL
ncbi:amidohydrolase family protein [candidate division CSSED10-310 bacterium]|uniref:Amidohydrolase family protein n=1 Tax=candidate division CSSED10-310 bacterium TaxID=2855610 RepID=A0ABV6Z391_UNCC1